MPAGAVHTDRYHSPVNVVWVTPEYPDPAATGGSAHEFELIRQLRADHDIHVIVAMIGDTPSSALTDLGVTVSRIEFEAHAAPATRLGVAKALLRAEPTIQYWLFRDRLPLLQRAVSSAEFRDVDLVHATHGELAPVLSSTPAATALLLFDSYVRYKQRELAAETLPRRRLKIAIELSRAKSWERRWYRGVDALAAVTPEDAAASAELLGREVAVLPNPIPDDFFDRPTTPREPGVVTFVGALLYPPNHDAIAWLASEIWPRVIERAPHARLRVVGRSGDNADVMSAVRRAVASVNGELVTDVDDIRPAYWSASAVVAPVRFGAGLRNKVIHAMACGAPVVATSIALEGIPVRVGDDVVVADDAESLANAIVSVIADEQRAATLAKNGLAVAEQLRSSSMAERVAAWWDDAIRHHAALPRTG